MLDMSTTSYCLLPYTQFYILNYKVVICHSIASLRSYSPSNSFFPCAYPPKHIVFLFIHSKGNFSALLFTIMKLCKLSTEAFKPPQYSPAIWNTTK